MERRDDIQKKVDDRLLGRLAPTPDFEQELADSPALAEALADTELAMEAIDAAEDMVLKARLQKLEKQLAGKKPKRHLKVVKDEKEEAVVRPIRPSFFKRNMVAIAASLLFLLSAAYYFLMVDSTPSTADLYAANFEPYRNIAVDLTRSNDASPEEVAFTAYENGDYEKAAQLLLALDGKPAYRFYAAQAYLAQKNYAEAKKILMPMADDAAFPLSKQANWYMALAELGSNELETAKARLQTISKTGNHPYSKEATELLQELNK